MTAFSVRSLEPDDFRRLLAYDWRPLVVERDTIYLFLARDHAQYCKVAEDGKGRALGILTAARSADGTAAFIFQVHVRSRKRRCGVGTALVRALERTAAGDGVRVIWFLARDGARAFYSHLGYSRADDVLPADAARYVRETKGTVVMAKRL